MLKRRRNYIFYQEYPFLMDRKRNNIEYYHCIQNISMNCKARLIIKRDIDVEAQISPIKQHNHTDKTGENCYSNYTRVYWIEFYFIKFLINFCSNFQIIDQRK